MAPEIFENKPKYGHKADIWGIGTILYEIIAAEPAFVCTGLKELLQLHERGFKPNSNLSLSPECVDLLRKMLDRNPTTRIDIAGIKAHPFIRPVSELLQDQVVEKGLNIVQEENEPADSDIKVVIPVPEDVIPAPVQPAPEQIEPQPSEVQPIEHVV